MAQRFGTVLVFREGITKHDAAAALDQLRNVLELPSESQDPVYFQKFIEGRMQACVSYVKRAFQMTDVVKEFDDSDGGPVWFVP